jgi:hypothetical protein
MQTHGIRFIESRHLILGMEVLEIVQTTYLWDAIAWVSSKYV